MDQTLGNPIKTSAKFQIIIREVKSAKVVPLLQSKFMITTLTCLKSNYINRLTKSKILKIKRQKYNLQIFYSMISNSKLPDLFITSPTSAVTL